MFASSIQRGIALFGGSLILPFERQHYLSTVLSVPYLQLCQEYNRSLSASQKTNQTGQMEFVVLAPRLSSQDFYDIATIVKLQRCLQTGAIIAASRGLDSLVRVTTPSQISTSQLTNEPYTADGKLIVENHPQNHLNRQQSVNASEMSFIIHNHRKLFFCNYETLYIPQEVYTKKQKEIFSHFILDMAKKSGFTSLSDDKQVKALASQNQGLFPRMQLLQLLNHFDEKFFLSHQLPTWVQTKYDILSNFDDHSFVNTLQDLYNHCKNY